MITKKTKETKYADLLDKMYGLEVTYLEYEHDWDSSFSAGEKAGMLRAAALLREALSSFKLDE